MFVLSLSFLSPLTCPACVTVTMFLVSLLLIEPWRFVREVESAAAFELNGRSAVVTWSSSRVKLRRGGGGEGEEELV